MSRLEADEKSDGQSQTSGCALSWLHRADRDVDGAWRAFLRDHAGTLHQVVRLFERDADRVEDCFLFVCEALRRGDLRRLRCFDESGSASFPTWLRAVVRNLCLDWHRHCFGRYRLPRSIARLPRLEQEIFRCVYLRGLSETETLHGTQAQFPGLTVSRLDDALVRIRAALDGNQRWRLLTRRPRLESLTRHDVEGDEPETRGLVDERDDPERAAARREEITRLRGALGSLEPKERLLLKMRFERGLGFGQIAGLTGLRGAGAARLAIDAALARVREVLDPQGLDELSVKGD